MGEWIYYSLNDFVKFKLNEVGRKKWENDLKVLRDSVPPKAQKLIDVKVPEPDEDGFHKLQLWEICQIFGSLMGNGFEPPIEIGILIKPAEEKELELGCEHGRLPNQPCPHCIGIGAASGRN